MLRDLTLLLLRLQLHARVFHWQTTSHARHLAFGGLYEALDGLADSVVEQLQGRLGRVRFDGLERLPLTNLDEVDPASLFGAYLAQVDGLLESKEVPADVENLLQEVAGALAKLLYLLTLA